MAINFKLTEWRGIRDDADDPMERSWVGWDERLSVQELFDQNRGLWRLSTRAAGEEIATFSYDGEIKIVASIEGIEQYPFRDSSIPPKSAIIGTVIEDGPIWQALIGQPVDNHRNPVSYLPDPGELVRVCSCGCGEQPSGRNRWISGHDQRALHERIAEQWGDSLGFVRWYDSTYRTNVSETGTSR